MNRHALMTIALVATLGCGTAEPALTRDIERVLVEKRARSCPDRHDRGGTLTLSRR